MPAQCNDATSLRTLYIFLLCDRERECSVLLFQFPLNFLHSFAITWMYCFVSVTERSSSIFNVEKDALRQFQLTCFQADGSSWSIRQGFGFRLKSYFGPKMDLYNLAANALCLMREGASIAFLIEESATVLRRLRRQCLFLRGVDSSFKATSRQGIRHPQRKIRPRDHRTPHTPVSPMGLQDMAGTTERHTKLFSLTGPGES